MSSQKPKPFHELEDDEEDEEMTECESVVVMRLMKHEKEWLSAGCVAHGERGSGSIKTLAERLAEQLCNETDDDNGDDE